MNWLSIAWPGLSGERGYFHSGAAVIALGGAFHCAFAAVLMWLLVLHWYWLWVFWAGVGKVVGAAFASPITLLVSVLCWWVALAPSLGLVRKSTHVCLVCAGHSIPFGVLVGFLGVFIVVSLAGLFCFCTVLFRN